MSAIPLANIVPQSQLIPSSPNALDGDKMTVDAPEVADPAAVKMVEYGNLGVKFSGWCKSYSLRGECPVCGDVWQAESEPRHYSGCLFLEAVNAQ